MKNGVLIILATFLLQVSQGQTDTTAPFRKYPVIPPISLLQTDSTVLTKESLKKNQQTMIMYFSPECEHCKHQMEDMIKQMSVLKKYQIVMATYQPMDEIKQFYQTYQVAKYPNIRMGRDTKYMLPPFYRMRSMPYMALYDAKGNLITTFEGNVKIDKLVEAFK